MSYSDYLEQLNADITEDKALKKFYLKIRSFATEESLHLYESQWTAFDRYSDAFFDYMDEDNKFKCLRQKKFYRKCARNGIVVQNKVDVQGNSHYYAEEKFTEDQFNDLNLEKYLEYSFERKTFSTPFETNCSFEVFYDIITYPVHYELITWKIEIPANTLEAVLAIVSQLQLPVCHLPVYSKFMYVLQCSRHCALFDELFEESLQYVEMKMRKLMIEKRLEQSKDGQYYLWSFGQLIHFRALFEDCHNVKKIYRLLTAMDNEVHQNAANKKYGLHVIDEKEELCF